MKTVTYELATREGGGHWYVLFVDGIRKAGNYGRIYPTQIEAEKAACAACKREARKS